MALGGWEAAPAMAGTSAVPGVYLDPSHPGCRRVIDAETGRVSGRDFLDANGLIGPPGTACTGHAPSELGAWSVAGQLVGPDAILIDFDAVDARPSGKQTRGTCADAACRRLRLPNGLWERVE